ncbi:hypothetical protein ACA910_017203 [Epithemia clementina (nom. ined.)]
MVSVLQRARDSGRCPPSLLTEDKADPDGFENDVTRLLDTSGFGLSSDTGVAEAFDSAVKKATILDLIPDQVQRASVLEQRRCLLLAIAGSTAPSSKTLERVLANGYLSTIKTWLDDTLSGRVGGVDLLLHMLTNIVALPVTKTLVKDSGMGKAIGSIEKHSLVRGSANEKVVQERVATIKEAWQSSVKARKSQDAKDSPVTTKSVKREAVSAIPSPTPPPKKVKTEHGDDTKKSTFSTLLKKVSGAHGGGPSSKAIAFSGPSRNGLSSKSESGTKKKSSNRVKWSDHFGGALETSRVIEGENVPASEPSTASSVSWTDRKKRDRAREKELLASVKKAKLLDDEEDEPALPVGSMMKATLSWSTPALLPERPDVTKPVLNSTEVQTQNERLKVVTPVPYMSENDVPADPVPMSDVEQALDMTSQSSAVVEFIPFFVPQQPEPSPAPVAPAPAATFGAVDISSSLHNPHTPTVASTGATPEFLQALGLPIFLVGQDVHALQTLASSPGLLSTMVDANGMYDQSRLLSLVQTLSGTPAHHDPPSAYNPANTTMGGYGPTGSSVPMYTPSPTYGGHSSGGSRSKSDDGNLHIAGYGPGTTQTDIITLFLPFVKVDEVVLKGTFAFVNTSDPVNAQRAKEALQGTLLNGMPIRINPAQRKAKDNSSTYGPTSASTYGPSVGAGTPAYNPVAPTNGSVAVADVYPVAAPPAPAAPPPPVIVHSQPPQPPQLYGPNQNVDHVRDDRGNPATKNLFVAGYGPGTTEQQLRDVFNQHANVIGVVLKGNFTFVNTSTRQEAVNARQMLQGVTLSGGPLRINFAKETGRLGTSFDLTYNQQSGPNAKRGPPAGPPSYYGRGY